MDFNTPLTAQEAADLLGIAKSTLYKMTMRRVIPSYRPTGGKLVFRREDLEAFLFSNRRASRTELDAQAVRARR